MNFEKFSDLKGQHSFLSASNYHWINDDEEKFRNRYKKFKAIQKGTEDHAFAAMCIGRNQKLPRSTQTLNLYVNDAIGFRMTPEVVLGYSKKAFGTADAIAFNDKRGELRIHDLKTGEVPASMHQLEVYTAYFCLMNAIKPMDISTELRIYQSNNIFAANPDPEIIMAIINKIVAFNKIMDEIDEQEA